VVTRPWGGPGTTRGTTESQQASVGGDGGDGGGAGVERTYPRCMLLYSTLMFFVFKVQVKRRRGGSNAPFL